MKIVFVSNYYNHHQHPVCEALSVLCESFYFISTNVMRDERKQLGYGIAEPSYVIHGYEEGKAKAAKDIVRNADVILCGAAQGEFSDPSLYRGKIVFYISERIYKNKAKPWRVMLNVVRFYNRFERKQQSYLLCPGAYAAADFNKSGTFKNRCFKWGYFPETKQYDIDRLLSKKDINKILWCGRLLSWKHPEHAIETAARLKARNIGFSMDIIGIGECEQQLKELISQYDLNGCVKMLGSMNPAEVRAHMENAGVFLFTSDRKEGWGAVLNEAMNSGCAIVASHAVGSAPYLIQNGENGFIFKSGDTDELYRSVKNILLDTQLQRNMGMAAYDSITTLWNAQTAAERLYSVAEECVGGRSILGKYQDGPLSKADLLGDNWF